MLRRALQPCSGVVGWWLRHRHDNQGNQGQHAGPFYRGLPGYALLARVGVVHPEPDETQIAEFSRILERGGVGILDEFAQAVNQGRIIPTVGMAQRLLIVNDGGEAIPGAQLLTAQETEGRRGHFGYYPFLLQKINPGYGEHLPATLPVA